MQTNDRQITELMKAVDTGSAQLPDFQRGWVWDDNRIKALQVLRVIFLLVQQCFWNMEMRIFASNTE